MKPVILNNSKPALTHIMTTFRVNYLNRMLNKLQELLDTHEEMYQTVNWYDGDFLNEDYEETLGFVFIAAQIFIAGAIGDSHKAVSAESPTQKDKERIMKNAPKFKNIRTKIELINAVANYYKHKGEGEPAGETKKILDGYKLLSEEYPITEAFHLITEDNKLDSFSSFLIGWRNHLFNTIKV